MGRGNDSKKQTDHQRSSSSSSSSSLFAPVTNIQSVCVCVCMYICTLPLVCSTASSNVHSLLEVGLESAKTMGRSLFAAMVVSTWVGRSEEER